MNDEARGPDWRWIAGGAIAVVGLLLAGGGNLLLSQHTAMEELRNSSQDTRIAAVEADMRSIRDMGTTIAVMSAKVNVLQGGQDRLEAALAKLNDLLGTRAGTPAAQSGKK